MTIEPLTTNLSQKQVFATYLNANCEIFMLADDTNVSSALTQANDINAKLVLEFTKISDWLVTNKLSLNILKTKYMIIGTEQSLIQPGSIPKIKITDCYLRRVEKLKHCAW